MTTDTANPTADAALEAAVDVLDGIVCECGHLHSAHVFEPDECRGEGSPCERGCRDFRPVDFIVVRLDINQIAQELARQAVLDWLPAALDNDTTVARLWAALLRCVEDECDAIRQERT